jgi:hypothetical protein
LNKPYKYKEKLKSRLLQIHQVNQKIKEKEKNNFLYLEKDEEINNK